MGDVMMQFYDAQQKQATTDNLKAQGDVILQETELKKAQILATLAGIPKIGVDTENIRFDLDQKRSLKNVYLETAAEMLRKLQVENKYTLGKDVRETAQNVVSVKEGMERILLLRKQSAKTAAERMQIDAQIKQIQTDTRLKELDEQLKKRNIQPHDPIFKRTIMEQLKKKFPSYNRNAPFGGGR